MSWEGGYQFQELLRGEVGVYLRRAHSTRRLFPLCKCLLLERVIECLPHLGKAGREWRVRKPVWEFRLWAGFTSRCPLGFDIHSFISFEVFVSRDPPEGEVESWVSLFEFLETVEEAINEVVGRVGASVLDGHQAGCVVCCGRHRVDTEE